MVMAEELVDIVILGASGFTGKYVIRELLKFVNEPNSAQPRKIAIAGRCKKKLAAALTWASQDSSLTASVPIFEADIGSLESLISLCKKTKVLISCVGPYRKFGKPVVEACVQTGVDYLDVTGEPEFMEEMEFLHHKKAMQTGPSVAHLCQLHSLLLILCDNVMHLLLMNEFWLLSVNLVHCLMAVFVAM